jgi:hypothetical protein
MVARNFDINELLFVLHNPSDRPTYLSEKSVRTSEATVNPVFAVAEQSDTLASGLKNAG